MKTKSSTITVKKIISWSIVMFVVTGAYLISGIADVSGSRGITEKIFVFFLGSVIIVQVIPAILLFGAMINGVLCMLGKKMAQVKD